MRRREREKQVAVLMLGGLASSGTPEVLVWEVDDHGHPAGKLFSACCSLLGRGKTKR